jgi:hypothetical protein
MYTDEDLNKAIDQGGFTKSAVTRFRTMIAESTHSAAIDEENFKLIGGFNDIFVVIACALLLFSSLWVLGAQEPLSYCVFSVISWGLSEFFIRQRKMALPAILLLLTFVGGMFNLGLSLLPSLSEQGLVLAAVLATVAAFAHWQRFRVPITIAVGTLAGLGILISSIMYFSPAARDGLLFFFFIAGIVTFVLAMKWDANDTQRITYKSDVAFWLHLLSAPLIIHPVFSMLGILSGEEGIASLLIVIILYVVMTSISLAIDRRAFMVSSLLYVIYAISTLMDHIGGVGYSLALTGVFIGTALLLLSAFWHSVRRTLVMQLPSNWQLNLPKTD